MKFRDFLSQLLKGSMDLSQDMVQLAVGDIMMVVALVCAIIITLLVFILALLLRLRRPVNDPAAQLVSGVRGKLEKLEMTANQLKTERARAKELYKQEFDQIKSDLLSLKEALQGSAISYKDVAPPPLGAPPAASKVDDYELEQLDKVHDSLDLDDTFEEDQEFEPLEEKKSLAEKMSKTRSGFFAKIKDIFSSKPALDEDTAEELEALLVSCDLGVDTTNRLMESIRESLAAGQQLNQDQLLAALSQKVETILKEGVDSGPEIVASPRDDGPTVVLVVGVNGVGKTTTVAKLSSSWKQSGKKVMMVAADTFRAAAVEQLKSWGQRLGVTVVSGSENAKPGTVVFDAMKQAHDENFDVVIIDTAGRLHNKSNLMQELEGVKNSIVRYQSSAPHETILVVDGTTGQNALSQAKEFNTAVTLSGVIVTKLDGTPKGGIVVAIKEALGVPVRYIGVGESDEDLRPFSAHDFAKALFDISDLNGNGSGEVSSAHARTRRKRRETTWTI